MSDVVNDIINVIKACLEDLGNDDLEVINFTNLENNFNFMLYLCQKVIIN